MQLHIVLTNPTTGLKAAFSAPEFAQNFMSLIVLGTFGLDPDNRVAAFSVLPPAAALPYEAQSGVSVTVTGVNRDGRSTKLLHDAIDRLEGLVEDTARGATSVEETTHVFSGMELDGEIETKPGSGVYSRNIERGDYLVAGRCGADDNANALVGSVSDHGHLRRGEDDDHESPAARRLRGGHVG